MKVEEIKKLLIEQYGVSEFDVARAKGKDALLDMLKAEQAIQGLKEAPEEEEEEEVGETPVMGDLEWSDYVLSLFDESELAEKDGNRYPTLKGLRRIFVKLFGLPTFSGVVKYESSLSEDSPGRASVNYLLRYDNYEYFGAADAFSGNIAGGYNVYPLSIAENRAEARAYRKALMLNIVTAEELGNEKTEFTSVLSSSGEFNEEEKMSDNQVIAIKTKCDQLGIDSEKFFDMIKKEFGVIALNKGQGLEALKRVVSYVNENSFPEEIKK